jgi:soluble lytic murein transglycosylase
MPKTSKMVANALGTSIKHKQEIYQPERNVQLGTKHLSQLINGFDQHYVLATAAYNAGGGRVKQWLKRYPNLATDQWIELIAFKETRDYVKAVMEYWVVFERLGNLPPTQLAQYIVPLPKQVDASANDLALTASLPSESTPSGSGSIFDWF